jgi:hypothetical protein
MVNVKNFLMEKKIQFLGVLLGIAMILSGSLMWHKKDPVTGKQTKTNIVNIILLIVGAVIVALSGFAMK